MGKYIIFITDKNKEDDIEHSMLFEPVMSHYDVATMIEKHYPNAKVISAGYWNTDIDDKIVCTGESKSLNIKHRESDSLLLSARCLRNL